MNTKFGKEEDVDVEIELCLSLGGPFKKPNKADHQPIEFRRAKDFIVDLNGVTTKHEINATRRKKPETNQQQRSGGEGVCKRIKVEEVTNGVSLGNGSRSGSDPYKEYGKDATTGSPISSSSDVSDPNSSSCQEGGSCQTKPVKSPVKNILTGTEETARSTDGPNSVAKETGKPPKPRPNGDKVNGNLVPFARMPCVTSTGNGPEGKTVNGFLYRYSKGEISIICVCHGKSFSPAEFIIHAGGSNVSHPLRHITVVSSTL